MENYLMMFTVIMCIQIGYCIKTYNMRDYCGKTISMTDENTKSARIYYEHKSRLRDKLFDIKCKVEISGWRGEELALRFTSLDTGSAGTVLQVRQGIAWEDSQSIFGLPSELSSDGSAITNTVYTTTRGRLLIRVKGDAPADQHRVFTMVINSFHTGSCKSSEHRCNNGRCIDSSLQCNGYNPCGDQSDCSGGMTTESWAVMVCVSVAGAFLVSFVTCKILTHCCSKCGKPDPATQTPQNISDRNDSERNNGDISVTFNLIGNNNILYAPINGTASGPNIERDGNGNIDIDSAHVLEELEQSAPPSYDDVISGESNNELSDNSDNGDSSTPSDNSQTESRSADTDRRRIRRPRRPTRRHSSRYLPRYSQVMRNRDNYEVRGDIEQAT